MRFWEIGKRNLKELYRNPISLAFLLGMPVAFIVIFGLVLGRQAPEAVALGIVDEDHSQVSGAFVDVFRDIPTLEITTYGNQSEAKKALGNGELPAYLVLPYGFSQSVADKQPLSLILAYNKADPAAPQRLTPVIDGVSLGFLNVPIPVDVELRQEESSISNPYINWFIPGMAVYGLMVLIPTVGAIMVRDKLGGLLPRLLTTPARPSDFVFAYTLPFIPVIVISTAIYLGVGFLMGLSIVGSFGLAYLILFLTGICCMGIAMIVGTLAGAPEQATGGSFVVILPLSMISGAWFHTEDMPVTVARVAGVFPFSHAINACRYVINGGVPLSNISHDLYWLIGWTVAFFAIGIVVFRRSMTK